ncbi:aluminum-activated malate transporter 8-like [Diospyros lotus]|uniref:aluminum-activated malate transporter 8-like n=1 Tax=Diospyros lotus TaxID=55363 RepID=UPI00225A8F5D|nr:aluminum-activated malate transporter 8-like [Diospyros lotus]
MKGKVLEVAKKAKKIGQDDPRRISHSLKVGLALTLVSSFYYLRPLYDGFGQSGMWAVLTVVVIFEFTVGATLSKGMNRGFATLLAGALGVGAQQMACLLGHKGHPIVLGLFVFLLAAASTFTRFFPNIKARYDYGVLIFILTFSLVAISGYRADEILVLSHQRLSTILIGGAICLVISIFLVPVWAGEELHNLVAANLEKLGSFLEGFGKECFKDSRDTGDSSIVAAREEKSFLQVYKGVLNTKATEDSLANFAWWEPGHGRFKFRHPWKQYLKIAALSRKCACHFEALCAYINSDIQEPTSFQRKIQQPCVKMSLESSKALKELATSIKTMTHPSAADVHMENSKTAAAKLKAAIEAASRETETSNLLDIIPAVAAASVLADIIKCIDKIGESVHELSHQAHFKKLEDQSTVSPEKPQLLHRGTVKPVSDVDGDGDSDRDHVIITVHETSLESPENIGNPQAPKSTVPRAEQ